MISLLTYVAIILGILAIARLVKVYELSATLKGNETEEAVSDSDTKFNAKLMMPFLLSFFAFCIYLIYSYKDNLLPESASEHGSEIDTLFNFNLIITGIVFIAVNIVLFYFAYISLLLRKGRSLSDPSGGLFACSLLFCGNVRNEIVQGFCLVNDFLF
jgi:cytochrome c oxidase subunit 2